MIRMHLFKFKCFTKTSTFVVLLLISGKGITPDVAREIFDAGADVITMGNHTWDNRAILQCIDAEPNLIRPAN